MRRHPGPWITSFAAFLLFAFLGYGIARWNGALADTSLGWKASQFFFSYQGLGLVKRGLVASAIHPFSVLQTPAGLFFLSVGFIAAYCATYAGLFRRATNTWDRNSWALLALVASSPALFLRQGFDIGRFDPLQLVITVAALACTRRGYLFTAGALVSAALLIHEGYAVIHAPFVFACYWEERRERGWIRGLRLCALPAITFLALFGVARFSGETPALVEYLAEHPAYLRAAGGKVDLDAVAVLTRTLPENAEYNARMFVEKHAALHLPIIFVWGALMVTFALRFLRLNERPVDLRFIACFAPLALSAIACDYYRWVALMAMNLFLLILLQAGDAQRNTKRWQAPCGWPTWLLLGTTLLGPISNTKSFPWLFQHLEKIWPGLPW